MIQHDTEENMIGIWFNQPGSAVIRSIARKLGYRRTFHSFAGRDRHACPDRHELEGIKKSFYDKLAGSPRLN